jgi:hypothetical protein
LILAKAQISYGCIICVVTNSASEYAYAYGVEPVKLALSLKETEY